MRGIRWILAVSLAGASLAPSAAAQDVGLAIGSRPAAIKMENLDGVQVDLAQFIGRKPVVLEFWATWCEVCEALQPRMNAAARRYGAQVEFITVAVGVNQTVRSVKRHLERNPIPGQILFDRDGRATRTFEAPATSYIVVLDRRGRVAYTGSGEDQNIAAVVARVIAS